MLNVLEYVTAISQHILAKLPRPCCDRSSW